MWLRVASQSGPAMRVVTLAGDPTVDPTLWLREQVDGLYAADARGRLYIFVRQALDATLAAAIERVIAERRLEPVVVAPADALASSASLGLLRRAGVSSVYVTLRGATAGVHDARAGGPGSWRRALVLLTAMARTGERMHVGVHIDVGPEIVPEVPGILRLAQKVGACEVLLWYGGLPAGESDGFDPAGALHALDGAVRAARKLGVRVRPVGFEGVRNVQVAGAGGACVASEVVVDLLRARVPLPSARGGVLATDGVSTAIAAAAPTGRALAQLAFELAAGGSPVLDLPPCLGGPPPGTGHAHAASVKCDACSRCPLDPRCTGVPRPVMEIPEVAGEVGPLRHWSAMPEEPRVLVLCPVVSEMVYGATFFSLARALAAAGARVDVVSPWAVHEDVPAAFRERQPKDRPDGVSAVERFVAAGPVERYDLIVAPDLETARSLLLGGGMAEATRLAVTDFHMLRGMDDWVSQWCAPGRRPEEGGWWPSDRVVLYSAFPGYARLYTRYGIPMRQVVWQPYALDLPSFPVERAATEGVSIVSGGRHRRDLDTLLAAAAQLGDEGQPIDLFADGSLATVPPRVRFCGAVPTVEFCAAVGRSRFMVVPVLDDPHKAAGITAMATAIVCGRPLVATDTAAARDYAIDGVNGLLVPAGDPRALAEAIERLDTDPVLLADLAAGARAAAVLLGTDTWADTLLGGSRSYDLERWMWAKWRARQPGLVPRPLRVSPRE